MNRQIQSNQQDGIRQLGKSKMSAYTIQQNKSPSDLKRYNESKTGLPQQQPIYKKIWFWAIVGVLVIAGVGVGIFFLVSHFKNSSTISSTYQPLDVQNVKSVGQLIVSKQQPSVTKQDSNLSNITSSSTSSRTRTLKPVAKSNQQNKTTVNQKVNQSQNTQSQKNMNQKPITQPEKINISENIASTAQLQPKAKVSIFSESNSSATINQSVLNSTQKIVDKLSKQNKVFYQISQQIVIKPKSKNHLRNRSGQNHKLVYK